MATTAKLVSGSSGNATLPATLMGGDSIHINSWSGTLETEIFDATGFDASPSNWREKATGLSHLTGSCTGWVDTVIVPLIGTAGTVNASGEVSGFILETRTGGSTDASYVFSGITSSVDIGVEKGGQTSVTVNFESSGAVTVTGYT